MTLAELTERMAKLEAEVIASSRVETAIQAALQRIDASLATAAQQRTLAAQERAELRAELAKLEAVPAELSNVRRILTGDDDKNGLRGEFRAFRTMVIGITLFVGGVIPAVALLITLIQAVGNGG